MAWVGLGQTQIIADLIGQCQGGNCEKRDGRDWAGVR